MPCQAENHSVRRLIGHEFHNVLINGHQWDVNKAYKHKIGDLYLYM